MKRILAGAVTMMAVVAGAAAPEIGKPAPDFAAPSTAGGVAKLADYKGKWLILYFYPKSFTPGCTKEACSLRDGFGGLRQLDAEILGVSFDDLETQRKFKAEHLLPFELLADTKKEVGKAYDAVMIGGLMPSRKTFIIDPDGNLAAVIDEVKTAGHDAQVAAELKRLQAARKP